MTGKLYTYKGKTMTLRDWAKVKGIGMRTLYHRIATGWPLAKALTVPPRGYATKTGGVSEDFPTLAGTGGGSVALGREGENGS
jgi:hypothetical protein